MPQNAIKPYPLLFLGTTDFSAECLKVLAESPHYKIVGVITKEDRPRSRRGLKAEGTPVKTFSQQRGLPIWTSEPLSLIKNKTLPSSLLAVVVAYGHILPEEFLNFFPKGAVNIHPSLLPRWRGAAPIERALIAGDTKTGVCLQLISEKLDAGDIIGKYEFPLTQEDTALEVYQKVKEFSKNLLLKDLLLFLQGEILPTAQKSLSPPVYAKKIKKEECEISWQDPALVIHNKIRGLSLGPQAFAFCRGERLKIYKSELVSESSSDFPFGSVIHCEGGRLTVACGESALNLLEVQRSGKKKQAIAEFLKGVALKKGEKLE